MCELSLKWWGHEMQSGSLNWLGMVAALVNSNTRWLRLLFTKGLLCDHQQGEPSLLLSFQSTWLTSEVIAEVKLSVLSHIV